METTGGTLGEPTESTLNKGLKHSEPCWMPFDQAELKMNAFVRTLPLEKQQEC